MTDIAREPDLLPFLEISGAGSEPWLFELVRDRASVGRLRGVNDIVLAPDVDRYVTGTCHCEIVHQPRPSRDWYVVDDGHSRNGTLLRHEGEMFEVRGSQVLTHGDVICILARLSETEPPAYWELAFHNPRATALVAPAARLEYDWVSARLYRIVATRRTEIANLRPQVHRLLRHMLSVNRDNANAPVLCSLEECMEAVWGEDPVLRTPQDLNGLILELRRKVELDPAKPSFVQTVRGLGFRLDTRPAQDQ